MKPFRTFFYLVALSLLSRVSHAQVPDPEEIFEKMCERVYEADTYRYTAEMTFRGIMDWKATSQMKMTAQQRRRFEKQRATMGDKLFVRIKMQGMQEDDKQRLEFSDIVATMIGKGKRTLSSTDQRVIAVYDGEKSYQTTLGSMPAMEVSQEEGWAIIPKPFDTYGLTFRLFPATKVRGIRGYPIGISGFTDKVARTFVIDPLTYRLLRIEARDEKAGTNSSQITFLKEEINPKLAPTRFCRFHQNPLL